MTNYVRNKTKYRAHLSDTYYDIVNKRSCLHVDAWMYQMPDDQLYFVIEYRAGGHDIVQRQVYRAEAGGLFQVSDDMDVQSQGIARTVGGAWSTRNAPWLTALHWRVIYPSLRQPRAGFKGHVSVRLHYVYTDYSVSEPCEGLENLYAVTSRPGRKPAVPRDLGAAIMAVDVPKWDKAQRSLLRTLGKLLR